VRILSWLIVLLLALAPPGQAADRFAVPTGAYWAAPPEGWNGRAALPATLFLHGAGSSAGEMLDYPGMRAAFNAAGVLLVAPDGIDRGWASPGSPRGGARDEVAFLDAVIADLKRRFPIDAGRVRVAGFSLGASAALDYACARGGQVQAVLTVAGVFWTPMPTRCEGGATNWLHIHGTADATFPLAGRMIRDRWRQGNTLGAIGMVARSWQCGLPEAAPALGDAACERQPGCGGAQVVRVCLHAGGHELRAEWLSDFHRWAEAVFAARVPG
jgi:polyhydroxybutyrate depolymerase